MRGVNGRDVVAVLPPSFANATWQDIAINAVMAGCRPEYLGVVGAAVEAISAGEFNLMGIATTTGSAAPLIIVNGPVAAALGINSGSNALGPGRTRERNHRARRQPRAAQCRRRHSRRSRYGHSGQPSKYTCCIAENEAASPWSPLHVERGFDPQRTS
jgi:hypothetical protein